MSSVLSRQPLPRCTTVLLSLHMSHFSIGFLLSHQFMFGCGYNVRIVRGAWQYRCQGCADCIRANLEAGNSILHVLCCIPAWLLLSCSKSLLSFLQNLHPPMPIRDHQVLDIHVGKAVFRQEDTAVRHSQDNDMVTDRCLRPQAGRVCQDHSCPCTGKHAQSWKGF